MKEFDFSAVFGKVSVRSPGFALTFDESEPVLPPPGSAMSLAPANQAGGCKGISALIADLHQKWSAAGKAVRRLVQIGTPALRP